MIKERLNIFREKMREYNLNGYIVFTEDYHGSEYVGDYFKVREYLSGFTGSAGTLLVLLDSAYLWTDGRYFIQAEKELSGSGIELMKMGEKDVPELIDFISKKLKKGERLGFDGRCMSEAFAKRLKKAVDAELVFDIDLAENVWIDRPALKKEKVWVHAMEYAGEERIDKIARLREKMSEEKASHFVTAKLDEIAWLMNLRGNDVECNPVFLSYLIMDKKEAILYVNKEILSDEIKDSLAKDNVKVKDYNEFYIDLSKLPKSAKVLLDEGVSSHMLIQSITKGAKIISKKSPVTIMKAIKNKTEQEGARRAHILDGVAVTRFIAWLKKNVKNGNLTEISVAEKLEEFRREMPGYIEESFDPIMAYADNGAIVHYSATEESSKTLLPKGLLLSDTGGHYKDGTTDITRTIALGPLSHKEKMAYTLTLVGHLRLRNAVFKKGLRGENLDYIAREMLYRHGLDFNHGTGHGVGNLLNVHEGPNNIRYRIPENGPVSAIFEEGMITSNEPGVYIQGEFGIRLENLILCVKKFESDYGTFLGFENLTMVPFDKAAIDVNYMTKDDVELLNAYHKLVYDNISEFMTGDELDFLDNATSPIFI